MEQKFEQITTCPKCGQNIKLVPSGTSQRTGKPYSSFYSCTSRECDYTARLTDKPQEVKPDSGNQLIMDGLENIIKSQRDIWTLLDMINSKLDK